MVLMKLSICSHVHVFRMRGQRTRGVVVHGQVPVVAQVNVEYLTFEHQIIGLFPTLLFPQEYCEKVAEIWSLLSLSIVGCTSCHLSVITTPKCTSRVA